MSFFKGSRQRKHPKILTQKLIDQGKPKELIILAYHLEMAANQQLLNYVEKYKKYVEQLRAGEQAEKPEMPPLCAMKRGQLVINRKEILKLAKEQLANKNK